MRGAKRCPHCREILDRETMPKAKGLKQEVDHGVLVLLIAIVLGAACYLVINLNEQSQRPSWSPGTSSDRRF